VRTLSVSPTAKWQRLHSGWGLAFCYAYRMYQNPISIDKAKEAYALIYRSFITPVKAPPPGKGCEGMNALQHIVLRESIVI